MKTFEIVAVVCAIVSVVMFPINLCMVSKNNAYIDTMNKQEEKMEKLKDDLYEIVQTHQLTKEKITNAAEACVNCAEETAKVSETYTKALIEADKNIKAIYEETMDSANKINMTWELIVKQAEEAEKELLKKYGYKNR